jgi:outer membrane protein assembly factor BamB
LRTRRWLALLALGVPAVLVVSASAALASPGDTWSQYQGGAARTGLAPAGAPEPPFSVSWRAETGIGDPTQVLGVPSPILSGDLAIVIGRGTVDAIDAASGDQTWSVPRALGPAAPAAVDGDTLVFTEGGGEGTASPTSSSPTPAVSSPSASPGRSSSPAASTDASTLVGMSLRSQERLWSVPLSDVSHTGVLITDHTAVVATDDGTVTAVDLDGHTTWSQDVGDHVLAPMAAGGGLVFASVRPEAQGTAAVVALDAGDGSQAWRYEPAGPVLDLGGPSLGGDGSSLYVVGSDASIRAISAADGILRWASAIYSPTSGSPPVVSPDAVVVTDQSGIVYAFDPANGQERWRFATNLPAASPPIITVSTVIQPASDGTVSAISVASGHEVWHGVIADSAVLGLAAAPGRLVASVTGTTPGLVGLTTDETGVTEDVVSPTVTNPVALVTNWLAAALPLTVLFVVIGRALAGMLGPAAFETAPDDELVDPWEVEDET